MKYERRNKMDNQLNIFDFLNNNYKITKPIRLIELFAGIGSQAKALERLGANFEHYRVVEFDKYAIKSYNAVHGTNFETSDITKTTAKDLAIEDTEHYTYLLTYSFPCQDLSLAGKGKGMEKGSGTRSGLLWEVERILSECEELPQVLLMENVPQVHGKKNMEHFKKWISALEELGYSNYWQDLNAKDYGIPQNRNRCFMISVLGNYKYEFPKPFELKLKLKDMLEDEVDEKYYLSDKQVDSIKFSTYTQNQRRIQEKDYSDTLCARDWKDPKCVKVNRKYGIFDTEKSTHQAGSVYDENGLSPTLDTMQGGYRQPCIEIKNNYVSNKYNQFIEENGYVQEVFNPYSKSEIKDIAPTQTTSCGSTGSSATILIKNTTKQGYLEATDGDGCYISNIDKKRGIVQKNMIPTLKTSLDIGVVVKECKEQK